MDELILDVVKLYARGYSCAQIIMILALEARGETNADLVRSMGGLGFGINWSGEVCGALSGGACLISLYAGKGDDAETADSRCRTMLSELVEWFTIAADDEYGGTRCHEILERFPDRSMCGRIVADTYGKCMEIIRSHGFDPRGGKKG